jgi:hypothetical protein
MRRQDMNKVTADERRLLCMERFTRFRFTKEHGGIADENDTRSFSEKLRTQYESEESDMTKIRDYNMNGTIILGVDAGDCDIIVTSLRKPVNIRLSAAGPICFQDMVTDYLKQCQKENAINGPVG